jgi:hypothetical protein
MENFYEVLPKLLKDIKPTDHPNNELIAPGEVPPGNIKG